MKVIIEEENENVSIRKKMRGCSMKAIMQALVASKLAETK